ncbi:hypothetical protein [Streptomyces zhihengii]|uniref:DUF4229 domain-containing protein n=1 Tax=Streptomyces zhihengii TaxID=1818004 RepID=A0ABS2UQ02_9ACTN|nr:hypothetical protein [Streptomyces zhihengii]MBM9618795.1 hypothetical protein [Streptomyces zhihengii]
MRTGGTPTTALAGEAGADGDRRSGVPGDSWRAAAPRPADGRAAPQEVAIAPLGILYTVCGLLLVVLFGEAAVTLLCGLLLVIPGGVSLVRAYLRAKRARG